MKKNSIFILLVVLILFAVGPLANLTLKGEKPQSENYFESLGYVGTQAALPPAPIGINPYSQIASFPLSDEIFCSHFDSASNTTQIYARDQSMNCIVVNCIPSNFLGYAQIIPIPNARAWLVEDLDQDGNVELVVQRDDNQDSYLEIYSAPNWTLKASILLQLKDKRCHPLAINIDADNHLELYLTPSAIWGWERAMIVQYDSQNDTYVVTDDISAPERIFGRTAAADFDNDGKVEFITGTLDGYALFEYGTTGLQYIGIISGTNYGYHATSLRPKPDGLTYAITGEIVYSGAYTFRLLKPTGADNTFVVDQVFTESNGYFGNHPSFAMDDDNDGLDEFYLNLYPNGRMYEWNTSLNQFVNIKTWNQQTYGTFKAFVPTDIDRDHKKEWAIYNHLELLRFFERN